MKNLIDFIKKVLSVKFIKFAIIGVMNTLIDVAVYTVLAGALHVNVYVSQVAGYTCGGLNSYIFNRSWTFKTEEGFFSRELIKFIVVTLAMLGLSLGILYVFYDMMHLNYFIAKIITTVLVLVVNFVVNNLWVFKKKTVGLDK